MACFNGDFKALREAVKSQISVLVANGGQSYSGCALSDFNQRSITCTLGNSGVKYYVNFSVGAGGKSRDKRGVSGVVNRASLSGVKKRHGSCQYRHWVPNRSK